MWKLYAAKTLYRTKAVGRPKAARPRGARVDLVEERVVLIRARSKAEALDRGQAEAEAYASGPSYVNPYGQEVITAYLGAIEVFEPFDDVGANKEIYSSTRLVAPTLSDEAVVDRLLGRDRNDEAELRIQFDVGTP